MLPARPFTFIFGGDMNEHTSRTTAYWESRYRQGGDSGRGSGGELLAFKSKIIQEFINANGINSIIDFGCGDGRLARMLQVFHYIGYDVSPTSVRMCQRKVQWGENKRFYLTKEYNGEHLELTMSLDVIFHLVEDEIYDAYMERLFHSADRFVIIYSSNHKEDDANYKGGHVRHRNFSLWVATRHPRWELFNFLKNPYPFKGNEDEGSFSDFYFYKRK